MSLLLVAGTLFIASSTNSKQVIGLVNLFFMACLVLFVTTKIRHKYYIIAFSVILYVVLFRLNLPDELSIRLGLFVYASLFCFAAFKIQISLTQERYKDYFSGEFLPAFVEKFGYDFEVYGKIKVSHIRDSKILKKDNYFNSDTKIFGKFNGLNFEFARLYIFEKGKLLARKIGAFFHATLEKNTNHKFFVISNDAEFIATKNLKKILSDDGEFNEIFSVYCDDTQTASQILIPALMKRLLNLKKRLNFPIAMSVIDDKICIFIATGKENFEPDIYKSVLRQSPAQTIKRELLHFFGITKIINQNTQI